MPVIVAYHCLTSQPIVTQLSGWHLISPDELGNRIDGRQSRGSQIFLKISKISKIP